MIEILIAAAIMVIMMSASAGMMSMTERQAEEMTRQAQATSIAEEGVQAVTSIADRSWTDVAVGTHGLAVGTSPTMWVLQGSSDVSEGFTRTVTITSVDADTRKVVVLVGWHPQGNRTATVEAQMLLTDWAFL